jgi:Outer membrane protein transport protein (OMPP1/FadL/TodX)
MKRGLALCAVACSLAASPDAHATAGTAFGESSRVAALASSVSARPGDAGSILMNPAGLCDVAEPEVQLSGELSRLSGYFKRTGEPKDETARTFGGYGFAAATPLPGPEWLQRFHLGIALFTPADRALRVAVDERTDSPRSPIYDGRADRISALGALAVEILPELRLGIGAQVSPSLDTPTEVSYDAGRSNSVERNVVIRLDRDLALGVAPFAGARVVPIPELAFGLVYRAASISKASGSQRTVAGGILADDPIDYYQFWDPAELVLGVATGPFADLTFSADLTWSRFSEFKNGFDQDVQPKFKNTLNPGLGVEWRGIHAFALRAGYRFEPTPVPAQSGDENFLGADTHVVALGAGIDLRELLHAPLAVDAHLRARLGGTQKAKKDAATLPDSNPDLPGQQIDNLGYPGFESKQSLMQVGLTLTIFVGKEKKERAK